MSKEVTAYKEVTVKVPKSYKYTCDTCGYEFKKGERKVSYYSTKGKQHACYNKPCSPFSNPKDHEYIWSIEKQSYVWEKIK